MLVVDKPAGPTSHDVVATVRRLLGIGRVGHTGTLDPFATGVLALCLGRATRLARFLTAADKVYRARVRFGFATSTDDLTGEPLGAPQSFVLDEVALRGRLAGFLGEQQQVPPAYSAKQVEGQRLHALARAGVAVAPRPATVRIHAIELHAVEGGDTAEIEVRCSVGTYVRALARDLGAALGWGGHLVSLRRLRSGEFGLEDAVPLDDVLRWAPDRVVPMGRLLGEMPVIHVDEPMAAAVRQGRDLPASVVAPGSPAATADRVRVVGPDGTLLALAIPVAQGGLHPDVVLVAG